MGITQVRLAEHEPNDDAHQLWRVLDHKAQIEYRSQLEVSQRIKLCAPSEGWGPGVYSLLNARFKMAMDLSGGDQKSLLGYGPRYAENQQVCGNMSTLR